MARGKGAYGVLYVFRSREETDRICGRWLRADEMAGEKTQGLIGLPKNSMDKIIGVSGEKMSRFF